MYPRLTAISWIGWQLLSCIKFNRHNFWAVCVMKFKWWGLVCTCPHNFLQSAIWKRKSHCTVFLSIQNWCIWKHENPHFVMENSLHPQPVDAVSSHRIIGPIFVVWTVTTQWSLKVLEKYFIPLSKVTLISTWCGSCKTVLDPTGPRKWLIS